MKKNWGRCFVLGNLAILSLSVITRYREAEAASSLTRFDSVQLREPLSPGEMEWLFHFYRFRAIHAKTGAIRNFALATDILIHPPVSLQDLAKPGPQFAALLIDLDKNSLHKYETKIYRQEFHRDNFSFPYVNYSKGTVHRGHCSAPVFCYGVTLDFKDTALLDVRAQSYRQTAFGKDGVIQNGELGPAAYVSRTRTHLDGSMILRESGKWEHYQVNGTGWEDHQWTRVDMHKAREVKWNWFAIQSDQGSESMIYQMENIRTGKIVKAFAATVHPSGEITEFRDLRVSETSHGDDHGMRVPISWKIESQEGGIMLQLSHYVPFPWFEISLGGLGTSRFLEGPCRAEGYMNNEWFSGNVWCESANPAWLSGK